jgi:hypothetical protein
MGKFLTYARVQRFMAGRFPDPEPELQCVRAYRAIMSLIFTAAVLNTCSPSELQRFTGYPIALIAAVAWNMINNGLWGSTYNSSDWLSPLGFMDDGAFMEHVDIALGGTWCLDAQFPHESIDTYRIFCQLDGSAARRYGTRR